MLSGANMERCLGYIERKGKMQCVKDTTFRGWAQALKSTLTKAGVPELPAHEDKGPEVKESLENIK